MDKSARDNRANQLNPNNFRYWHCRGMEMPENPLEVAQNFKRQYSKHELDNRANQLNPNHPAYWKSRGLL